MNKTPHVPTFPDAMRNFRDQIFYDLYCHLPGSIVSFDRASGLASVAIGLKRVVPNYAVPTGQNTYAYPQLDSVPVYTLQGSGGSVGADPAPGDPCLLVVLDRNIDAWLQNGGAQAPVSDRAHDLSDCFCFVGFNPTTKPLISARLAGECGISDALAKVVVKNGLVDISNGPLPANNLGGILTTLFSALAADPGLSPASHTALALANTELAALLY